MSTCPSLQGTNIAGVYMKQAQGQIAITEMILGISIDFDPIQQIIHDLF